MEYLILLKNINIHLVTQYCNIQIIFRLKELPNLEIEGSRLINQPRAQKHSNNEVERDILIRNSYEEREGETSGYASDSIEPTVIQTAEVKSIFL